MEKEFLDKIILTLLITAIFVLSFFVLRPILMTLFLAFILAYTFFPLYAFFFKRTKSKSFSAFIVTFFLVLFVVLPLIFLTPLLVMDVKSLYLSSQNIKISQGIKAIFSSNIYEEILKTIDLRFSEAVSKFFGYLASSFDSFIYGFPQLVINFIIFLFLFYYIIQNLDENFKEIKKLIPIKEEIMEKFAFEFKNVTKSIIYGQIFLGIVQGLLMGLFLYVIRFENSLFFTLIGILAGILPIVGQSLVSVPVGLILLSNGQIILAIVLFVYGNIVGWFIDGFMRPYILSERTILSVSLSFVGIIGGVYSFGIPGVIIGPPLLAYLVLIISFYKEEIHKK